MDHLAVASVIVLAAVAPLTAPGVGAQAVAESWRGFDVDRGQEFSLSFVGTDAHVYPVGPEGGRYALQWASPDGLTSYWRKQGAGAPHRGDAGQGARLIVHRFPFDTSRGYATIDWPEEPDPFGRLAIRGSICREQLGDVFTRCIPR